LVIHKIIKAIYENLGYEVLAVKNRIIDNTKVYVAFIDLSLNHISETLLDEQEKLINEILSIELDNVPIRLLCKP